MNYSLAAKLTVYSIILVTAYFWIAQPITRLARNLWRMFYEWFYSEELATAEEFNRLIRSDRLARNLSVAEYIDGLGQHYVWEGEGEAFALDAPEEKGAA